MADDITNVLKEQRCFIPNSNNYLHSQIKSIQHYEELWTHAKDHPEEFWGSQAMQHLTWIKPFHRVLDWKLPHAKWFLGGTINASYNCLDRHLNSFRKNKAALIWEGEPGDQRVLTYQDLHREVSKFSNALKSLGVKKGDCVTIYMPMIPETVVAMLACARLGIMHNVVFAGFSGEALAERNNDSKAVLVITADAVYRKGQLVALKKNVDLALEQSTTVKQVVVFNRAQQDVNMKKGRDFWWHELVKSQSALCEAEPLDSEHPLFILYTSGSTGKPKGILHTTAGYLLGAAFSSKYIFDFKEEDTYWCTADVGWITGHSYIVYGPLANGATVFMYEGAPTWPEPDRFWQMIAKYKVNILYTAPTAIRTFVRLGDDWPNKHDLSSLRLLGTVGEPINPETWLWYHRVIGKEKCPIVDTWWQTETGSIMISPLPGCTPLAPGSATRPFFGIIPDVVDKQGHSQPTNKGGFLVIRQPWPSMLRTIYGDDERYKKTYWQQIPGCYFTGDGARQDERGNFWIMGRIDDVLNVSGHRLSTMEIESSLVSHSSVVEAAVVGKPHDIKGEAICCFVTLQENQKPSESLKQQLIDHVAQHIGSLARPDEIRFTDALPKTRSGKIMRRLLRDVAVGKMPHQDMTTLEDLSILAKLREDEE